jgi:hypothetical protein
LGSVTWGKICEAFFINMMIYINFRSSYSAMSGMLTPY